MVYWFKWKQELFWASTTTLSIVLLTNLLTFDPSQIADWRIWAIGICGASVRAVAGAVLDVVRRMMMARSEADAAADKRPVIHVECGHVAFLTNAPAIVGELIDAGEAFTLDGAPASLDAIHCNNCGKMLAGARVMEGVWVTVTKAN